MKKNLITNLLILGVIIVWSVVFYNIFNPSDKNKPEQTASNVQTRTKEKKRTELLLNYRNPFKGVAIEITKNTEEQKVEITKEPPTFRYKGFIRGVKNNVIIIENNGINEIIHRSDSILEYKVVSINNDSVVLRKKGVRYRLTKN